jgi:hypothetical protein
MMKFKIVPRRKERLLVLSGGAPREVLGFISLLFHMAHLLITMYIIQMLFLKVFVSFEGD